MLIFSIMSVYNTKNQELFYKNEAMDYIYHTSL